MFKMVFRLSLVTSIFAGSFFLTAHAQSFFTNTPQAGGVSSTTTTRRQMITVDQFQQSAKQAIDAANKSLEQKIDMQKQLSMPKPSSTPGMPPPASTATSTTTTVTTPNTSISPAKPQDVYTGFKPVNSNSTPATPAPSQPSNSGSSGWSIKY
jgi:hypothetical protein